MNKQLGASNIYLIGMMGSGKTTVGKLLAKQLDCGFFDTALRQQTDKKQRWTYN